MKPAYRLAPAKHGKGLYATRDIMAGEIIHISPGGKKITYQELLKKRITDNPLQVSPRRYIDWGAPDLYVNHSCDPNCGLTTYPHLELVAIKDIKKDDELYWDYSTSIDKDTECSFVCGCGAKHCRKAAGGFKWLPKTLKEKYIRLAVVQEYLLKER